MCVSKGHRLRACVWNNLDFVLLAIITYAWPSSPPFKDESGVFALNSHWLSSWALVVVSA